MASARASTRTPGEGSRVGAGRPTRAVGAENRRRLLAAGLEAFGRKGFHGTTTRDIAAAAGMSPAALYVHHRSKEELLFLLCAEGHRELLKRLRAADPGSGVDASGSEGARGPETGVATEGTGTDGLDTEPETDGPEHDGSASADRELGDRETGAREHGGQEHGGQERCAEEGCTQGPGDPVARLTAFVRTWVLTHIEGHLMARVINDELDALDPEHLAEIMTDRLALQALLRGIVDDGLARGVFHTTDPGLTVRALLSMGVDVARWYRTEGRWTPEEIAARYAALALRMLGASDPGATTPPGAPAPGARDRHDGDARAAG